MGKKSDNRRKTSISKAELKDLYKNKKWRITELAEKYNCSWNTIAYWLRKYNIKLRTATESGKLFSTREETKIPKDKLYGLYINKKLKLSEIAKLFNCKIPTITNRLRKYNIKIRRAKWIKVKITKKQLKELYLNKRLTTYEIAEIFQCCQATIWKRLHQFNIPSRNPQELHCNIPTKKELIKYYIKEGLSNWKIEEKYGYNRGTVYRKLREYGLIKTRAGSHIKYKRRNFDGDIIQKAYLIGFKLGDLRARKIWENSETIHVDCGSNIPEQIYLIKNLFNKYGGVWIKRNKNRGNYFQIEAYLDLSFSFLLTKQLPSWILKKREHFFSFLAGFTDAEGCIKLNNKNRAFYSLGNYDYKLLNIIRGKLMENKIFCPKITVSQTKGKLSANGYINNGDYCILAITRKESLFNLLSLMEPYIKHKQKIKDLKIAKNNIIERNERNGYINWRK